MIRKQLYLDEEQDRALKARAKELGLSEAEIVRRALDQVLRGDVLSGHRKNQQVVLQALFSDAERLAGTKALPEGYRFEHQALYEEDERSTHWDKERRIYSTRIFWYTPSTTATATRSNAAAR